MKQLLDRAKDIKLVRKLSRRAKAVVVVSALLPVLVYLDGQFGTGLGRDVLEKGGVVFVELLLYLTEML